MLDEMSQCLHIAADVDRVHVEVAVEKFGRQ